MKENKVSSYLLYAIGEIFLVVIGILIAVNLNNWNENRKQKIIQQKYFINLKTDLEADLISLDQAREMALRKILAARNLRKRANQDSVGSLYDFSNVAYKLIFVGGFSPNQSTLKEMVSTGNFSNIQNDSLKLKLTNLNQAYDLIGFAQEHIRNDYDVFLENFQEHVDWGNYYNLSLTEDPMNMVFDSLRIESNKSQFENDIRGLLKDKVFLNNIFLIEVNYTYLKPIYGTTKEQVEKIIFLIDKELKE